MSDSENLEAKYGRRKSSASQNDNSNPQIQDDKSSVNDIKAKYGRTGANENHQPEPEKKEVKISTKEIKENIAQTLSQYSKKNNELSRPAGEKENITIKKEETKFIKFLKAVMIFLILLVIACIAVAFSAKSKVNIEGEQIIDRIKKAETLYYTMAGKYHYFSKTNYDNTLGIDISKSIYFKYYEVIPTPESGNYEAKLFGATNAFTITYYTVKSWLTK